MYLQNRTLKLFYFFSFLTLACGSAFSATHDEEPSGACAAPRGN